MKANELNSALKRRPATRTAGTILPPIETDCTHTMRHPKIVSCGLATVSRIEQTAVRLASARSIGHETLDSLIDYLQAYAPGGYFGSEQDGEMEVTVGVRFKPKAHTES